MIHIKGVGGAPGIAHGKVAVKESRQAAVARKNVADPESEVAKLDRARAACIDTTRRLRERALKELGEKEAAIFQAHVLILTDEEFFDQIKDNIRNNKVNAEWALREERDRLAAVFAAMKTKYLQERAADIADIADSLTKEMLGITDDFTVGPDQGKIILAASELTPADTIKLDKQALAGLLTEFGGETSHTVILAKTLGIPAIVGVGNLMATIKNRDEVILDGQTGDVYIAPEPAVVDKLKQKKALQDKLAALVKEDGAAAAVTRDGKRIAVYGNLGDSESCDAIVANFGEGIGLLRTEFLYMSRRQQPSEEEQFTVYRAVVEKLGGREVVIRTLDIGGDKQLDYIAIPKEDNPFLGYRAIRICLEDEKLFLSQLKAILRASAFGDVKIMFPMIVTIEELRQAKALLAQAKTQLRAERQEFADPIGVGIMIETPAAAVMAGDFAKEVDFFSIGTNDLIQYVTAADRMNPKVQNLYKACNPAVLRLIRHVAAAAQAHNISVSVCGEMASDYRMVPLLVGLGIDKLSVVPGAIGLTKHLVRNTSLAEIRPEVDKILSYPLVGQVEEQLERLGQKLLAANIAR